MQQIYLNAFQIDKRFPRLVIIIKQWADAAGIADPSAGTFSGFCLTLLVLFFLQQTDPPVLPNLQHEHVEMFNNDIPVESLFYNNDIRQLVIKSSNTQCVGELLQQFFHFYTNVITFEDDQISISSGATKPRRRSDRAPLIFVEEPYDPSKNVACVIFKPPARPIHLGSRKLKKH